MSSSSMLSSDVMNYLIMRYLQESGFSHSAFVFGAESSVLRTTIAPDSVPPGSLIMFVQKGLQYLELEANLDGQDGVLEGEFKLLSPVDLLTMDVDALRQQVLDRKDEDKVKGKRGAKNKDKGPQAMDTDTDISPSCVITLKGHESDVVTQAWSPSDTLLASISSGPEPARIWSFPSSSSGATKASCTTLQHNDKSENTSMDWSQDGSLIATGHTDGLTRVWSKDGRLQKVLKKPGINLHINSVKFNKRGDTLLNCYDKTAVVWDIKSGESKQEFASHTGLVLDIDWRNQISFATCSADKSILVWKLGEKDPLRTWKGHTNEVNMIKWDSSGRMLASCSDDKSAKIWSISSEKVHLDLRDGDKEIFSVKWSPTGVGSLNPNQSLLLATCSEDASVKLWDPEKGNCLNTFNPNSDSKKVDWASMAFSPNGKLLACTSFSRILNVYSVDDGSIVKTYKGTDKLLDVSWSKEGDKLACCVNDKTLVALDIRF